MKDNDTIASLDSLKTQVNTFLIDTGTARRLSETDRDYYDGYQWSTEEISKLKARKQAPIVVNRVKPKVEGLKGLLSVRKTDIKAFPRNYKHDENAAHAITDALRYVSDANDFDSVKADAFEHKIIEGYCAAIAEVVEKNNEPDIQINLIPWDRFYFDPRSSRRDFKDVRYMGQMIWMDQDQLTELFPDKAEEISNLAPSGDDNDETFQDKPRWVNDNPQRKRYRIVQHYFIKNGVWHIAIFCTTIFLVEPQPSPYLDEHGQPTCPIEADSAYIDRNNNRYGEVRGFISQQDEINHRRSKALHLLSSRQIMARKGAIDDVDALKREFSKPDGVIEYSGDQGDIDIVPTNDFTQGQILLYQDAKAELDATSFNAQLSGERQKGDLSGKAIDRLQSAGTMEIDSLYRGFSGWEKRIHRQVWARVKQYWSAEKWIRVTDDQDNLRWIGLNSEITLQKMLEETINDDSKTLTERTGASAAYQQMMQTQDPRLQTIVEVKNNVAELDVDVILEQSFDVVNIQQEQFELLIQFAQSSQDIDIIELIELSQLRNKKELIEKIESRRAQASQAQQMQVQGEQVKNAKIYAETQATTQKAEQTAIENHLLLTQPEKVNSVSV